MISSELLSEVLGIKATPTEICENGKITINGKTIKKGKSLIFVFGQSDVISNINIYELMHLCKEWVEKQDKTQYSVFSAPKIAYITSMFDLSGNNNDKWFDANSEIDAVFKATQWIYDAKQ